MSLVGLVCAYYTTKIRTRKPFNPMLGETYEFVDDRVKFIAEKC